MLSHFRPVRLCVTQWPAACQVSLSMGFSMQEYLSGFPYLPPGDRPNPGIELTSLIPPSLAGRFFITSSICKAPLEWYDLHIWGCLYFSQQFWFQLLIHPARHFVWCTLHRSEIRRVTIFSLETVLSQFLNSPLFISVSNCYLLTCIQVSQEAGKVVWDSHLFKNFLQFVVINSQRLWCSQWSRSRYFSGIPLLFLWHSGR